MNVLVTAGDFTDAGYGRLLRLNPDKQSCEIFLEYLPPPNLCVPGKGFTGASWLGTASESDLLVCGFAAVYRINPRTWQVSAIYHQPCMNDLHHVFQAQNLFYVCNTGLDRVDCFDLKTGNFVGGYALTSAWKTGLTLHIGDAQAGTAQGNYYGYSGEGTPPFHLRRIRDCVHPNHVTRLGKRLLVTRFRDRAVQDLHSWEYLLQDLPGHPHDGCVHEDMFWLTTTNGLLLGYAVSKHHLAAKPIVQLDIFDQFGYSGWCRGLCVTNEFFIIGLTRIMETHPARWCERDPAQTTTAVLWVRRNSLTLAACIELKHVSPHPKLFSILPCS